MNRLSDFKTFNQFFTRKLKEGARPISEPENKENLCSPCDGCVLKQGTINQFQKTIECVKGRSYTLREFMFGLDNYEGEEEINSLIGKVKARGKKLFY